MSLNLAREENVSSTRIMTLDSDRVNRGREESWLVDESKRNIENKIAILLGQNYKQIKFFEKS